MTSPRVSQLWRGIRLGCRGLATVFFWTVWLALFVAFLAQIGIALSRRLEVPSFILRPLEQRFAASGVQARLGSATFDPTGGVLVENVRLSLPEYAEPVADIRAIYIELNPWLLLAGQLEPRHVHITGVKFSVPAMLAPSGRSEELLTDLDLVLAPSDDEVRIEQLVTRIAGVEITARGTVHLARERPVDRIEPIPMVAALARHYPSFSRQLIRAAAEVSALEEPSVHVVFSPSLTRGAVADVELFARRVQLPQRPEFIATDVLATIRLPLLGDATSLVPLSFSAAELHGPSGLVARQVLARARGLLRRDPFAYEPRAVELSAKQIEGRGIAVEAFTADIDPTSWPRFDTTVQAALGESTATIQATANIAEKTAHARVDATLSPSLLDLVGKILRRDLRAFVDFGAPVEISGAADFTSDWKFRHFAGHVTATKIDARRVPMDSIAGEIEFDGHRIIVRHATARLGDNFARGSFEQDLATHEFRFLLDGRLRPLAISGWFRPWWQNFFETLEFPAAPPNASVDVRGRWRAGHETTVFVFAESSRPILRGARFDYARARLFIRPHFIDGLELFGTHGAGELRGTFTRHFDLQQRNWRDLTLVFESTLELENGGNLLGPTLAQQLKPFYFERAPRLKVIGQFDGPAAASGPTYTVRIAGDSTGDFSFHRFPARNLTFEALLRDSEITLDKFEAEVASGTLSGRARIWGADGERRLGFDASLRGASLGRAISTVSNYAAIRRGETPDGSEKFVSSRSNVRLDLAVSAEGLVDDLYSYHGSGNAALDGPELGEVRLLGGLSALLDFTALRFTSARANFRVQGPILVFSGVDVTGPNSAIQAHGDYSLPKQQLNFNARVYPFHESKSLIQSVVGAVLTPLSNILEVKLSGPLDEPKWAFVMGPTNLLRSLGNAGTGSEATEDLRPTSKPPNSAPDDTNSLKSAEGTPSAEKTN